METILSIIITAKDKKDKKLKSLLESIKKQNYPKSNYEVLIITEGTSETAKAIGIKRARGKFVLILASDNYLVNTNFLSLGVSILEAGYTHTYPRYYHHDWSDDILTRYFALIGGNDPLAFYMGKQDKFPLVDIGYSCDSFPSLGDNGYFVRRDIIMQSDMDNYSHVDNCYDVKDKLFGPPMWAFIKHDTGGNIFQYFIKRYKHVINNAFNQNRRWHLVDLKNKDDRRRLICFIVLALTLWLPLRTSIRGYKIIKDRAWFLHPIMCFLTVLIYSVAVVHMTLRRVYRLLFALVEGNVLKKH